LGKFGMPVVVALNHFVSDTDAEFAVVRDAMAAKGVEVIRCTHWGDGAPGAAELARAVLKRINSGEAAYKPLYPSGMKLADKIRTIATEIYHAKDIARPGSRKTGSANCRSASPRRSTASPPIRR
jgi:formate--tetrahydrofolate ligase